MENTACEKHGKAFILTLRQLADFTSHLQDTNLQRVQQSETGLHL